MDNDSFFKGRSTFSCLFGPIIGAVNQKTLLPCTSDIKLVTSQSQNSQTRKGKKNPLNVTPKMYLQLCYPTRRKMPQSWRQVYRLYVCVCVRGSSLLCYLPLRFNRFCCLFVTFTFERLRPIWHSVRAESVGLYVKTKTAITEGPGVNPCSVTFPVRTDVILKCWTKRVLFLVFFFFKKGT